MHTKNSIQRTAIFLTILFFSLNCTSPANSQPLEPDPLPDSDKKIQLSLLLDTSNSMDGLINQAKSQLWSIVNELSKAKCDGESIDLQIALYEYGNDNLPSSEGYIRQVVPLTTDLDEISKGLFELTTNGGNEFCGEVIQSALDQLNWSANAENLQLIYIAGNEPFTQGRVDYKKACLKAKSYNVVVNTIFCGNFNEGINTYWKEGATLTGGSYASIEQNRKTVYIASPYDDAITALNTRLNDTYIVYGRKGAEKKSNQIAQDSNAEFYGKENNVKRIVSKSSHVYKNKSWDLVDASEEKDFSIDKVEKESLPAEMQNLNDSEKVKYIEQKRKERKQIQSEIQSLNIKREKYIIAQKSETDTEEMLDKAITGAIKDQAKAKGITIK